MSHSSAPAQHRPDCRSKVLVAVPEQLMFPWDEPLGRPLNTHEVGQFAVTQVAGDATGEAQVAPMNTEEQPAQHQGAAAGLLKSQEWKQLGAELSFLCQYFRRRRCKVANAARKAQKLYIELGGSA